MTAAKERLEAITQILNKEVPKQEQFVLENHPVDQVRKLRVAIIGAGLSGILGGILLPAKVPGIELTIFEKNQDVGGTWLENIYPGVRCDVPAHAYQSTFDPNTQWTEEFAQGAEIRKYWQNLAAKHDLYRLIKFRQNVQKAEWHDVKKQWVLTAEDLATQRVSSHEFDIVLPALGHFNAWRLPDYPGLNEFEGHLRHSSNWDPDFDPTNKTVAVIGNGASGIQVVPELQKVVKHLDHYARSRTWIAGSLGGRDREAEPMYFSAEQLKDFEDPEKYLQYRKALEGTYWRRFGALFKDSEESVEARRAFKDLMAARLPNNPEILEALVPDFSPHCRRLTPGPGYLEALTEENVNFIQTPIRRFTKDGIETVDGTHRKVDAIICSTGANVDFAPPFPIVSGKIDLSSAWQPAGAWGFPYSYLGIGVPGFPNLFFIHGPNSIGPSGTLPHGVEIQVVYIARLLRKIASQGIQTAAPSKAATDDFVEYCDAFFPTTVLTENCSSWSNGRRPGGKIHGHWPGSASHVNHVRREPRWEDWEYGLLPGNKSKNRFAYLGNGWTTKELDPGSDLTPYLKPPDKVDLRDWHESWWDL
ncbi:hypothetical protein MBLNU459_g4934t1 [Dothideomycetes sp. NU459]